MKVNIIFGTEAGDSELVAEDVSEVFADDFEVTVANMEDVDVDKIELDAIYIIICSTYGEGDLPNSAIPFYEALSAARPSLFGLHYAVLGRGDSTYLNSYSRGSEIIHELFEELGAIRFGEYGRDDASDWKQPDDLATKWAEGIVAEIPALAEKVAS